MLLHTSSLPRSAVQIPRGRAVVTLAQPKPSTSERSIEDTQRETGAGLKTVWYAAELFGKAVGKPGTGAPPSVADPASPQQAAAPLSREQLLASIRQDYDVNYFISGAGDMAGYADDCEFADPFVSFKGTKRFKQNVGNLGSRMSDVRLEVYSMEEVGQACLKTRWRFSCLLDLPWRPRLAAAGSTEHVLDLAQGRVVRHIESWDTEPGRVVAQLFKPSARVPSNAWETFFMSASAGDGWGMWLSASPLVLRLTLPVVAVSLAVKVATGEGLPGGALGALEGLSWLLAAGAGATQLYSLVKGATGGEAG
ncbi:SOUL heme-binding protein [Haematococcus lacustris]